MLTLMKGEGMDLAEDERKNPRHPASSSQQTIKYHFKDHKDRVSFLSFTDWNLGKMFSMCMRQQNSQSVCWNIASHADVHRGSSRVPAPRSLRRIAWRAKRASGRGYYWKCVINLISLSPMHYRSFERVVCPTHIEPWLLQQHNRSSR